MIQNESDGPQYFVGTEGELPLGSGPDIAQKAEFLPIEEEQKER
jgi:hypothetical protein